MVVVVQSCVFCWQLVVDTVDLVYFILKFQSHADLLVEWLLGFFKILDEDGFFSLEISVLFT